VLATGRAGDFSRVGYLLAAMIVFHRVDRAGIVQGSSGKLLGAIRRAAHQLGSARSTSDRLSGFETPNPGPLRRAMNAMGGCSALPMPRGLARSLFLDRCRRGAYVFTHSADLAIVGFVRCGSQVCQ